MVYIICVVIGFITAFAGSLIGLGGGVILIPSLLLLHHYTDMFAWATPQIIVGVSLMVMVITALSSSLSYFKKGRVDYKTGYLFLVGSIPAGIFGSWLNQYINVDRFSLYFGILMLSISFLFLLKREPDQTAYRNYNRAFQIGDQTYYYSISFWKIFLISIVIGLLSGLFGIGGGSIIVPAMILLFGIPAHIASATSMFIILFISIITVSSHVFLGHISWQYVFFFIPGAWLGGVLGAKTNQRLNGRTLEWILRILLVIIGIRLMIEGV